jgi:prevent-host-death family protein
MDQIPIRVLNQDTASVLERVEHGETVEITNRGKPVARLVPISGGDELDDLIADGKVIPATIHGRWRAPAGEIDPEANAGELVRQLRDEERW